MLGEWILGVIIWIALGLPGYFLVRSQHRRRQWRWTVADRKGWLFLAATMGPALTAGFLIQWLINLGSDRDAKW